MIIPTGVGASIGGFGGDATQDMVNIASHCDVLITHPNVANAGIFQQLPDNALYVEGYALDGFFRDDWSLHPIKKQGANKIGVIFDAGIETGMRVLHDNTINAVKTVYGVDISIIETTREALDITCTLSESGASLGTLHNPEVLLNACEKALEQGATALALACRMPEVDEALEAAYKKQGGVDPIGGIEAILSHLVVSTFNIPCAHAPVFDWETAKPELNEVLDPRAAVEFIAPTFLPCVLTGLSRSPQLKETASTASPFSIHDLDALITPWDCLGNIPVLSALEKNIPVIAIKSNQTVLNVSINNLSQILPEHIKSAKTLISADSYDEAALILNKLKSKKLSLLTS